MTNAVKYSYCGCFHSLDDVDANFAYPHDASQWDDDVPPEEPPPGCGYDEE